MLDEKDDKLMDRERLAREAENELKRGQLKLTQDNEALHNRSLKLEQAEKNQEDASKKVRPPPSRASEASAKKTSGSGVPTCCDLLLLCERSGRE